MNRQQKAEYAHLRFQARAVERGAIVSKPLVETRYDFILDEDGVMKRIQVKYCGVKSSGSNGACQVNLRSQGHTSRKPHYTKDEVDFIMVYVASADVVVCLPPELFDGKSSIQLRTEPPKNGQAKGLHLVSELVW